MWDWDSAAVVADADMQPLTDYSPDVAKSPPTKFNSDDLLSIDQVDDVVVTGYLPADFSASWWEVSYGTDTGSTFDVDPWCSLVNYMTNVSPSDGSTYVVPEGVDANYLTNAINHLRQFNPADPVEHANLLNEFYAMYTDPEHPYFLDFKSWDDTGGDNPIVSWWNATGGVSTGSVFETAGNFFYGFIGMMGGLTSAELLFAAAVTQSGNDNIIDFFTRGDDPNDRPHVDAGIAMAERYMTEPEFWSAIAIADGQCGQ